MDIETLLSQLFLASIAFVANLFSAFAGGGAGLIQLPALILLGLPFPIALATHKFASVALGAGAGLRHLQNGKLKPLISAVILVFGLPGVWLGAKMALFIPGDIGTFVLGALTIWLGLYSSKRPHLGTSMIDERNNLHHHLLGGLVLFLIGFLNGSFSSGSGLFVTIWLVRWFGLSYITAVAYTLILVGLFWNSTGAIVLGLNAEVQWNWIPGLTLGSLIGGYVGAQLSLLKGSRKVKRAFEILSFTMGISLIFRSLL